MDKKEFISFLKIENIDLNQKSIENFDSFLEFLIQENKKYNLTSITKIEEVYEKHFYDSLSILFHQNLHDDILDIGCGGGFPGLPLKIVKPDINLYCLDSTAKKINYIEELSKKLDLEVCGIVARAEEYKQKQFDFVVSRGVAQLNILLELICDLVKKDGIIICMKGSHYKDELNNAKNCIEKLGYKLDSVYEYHLPTDNSLHANLVFKKIAAHNKKYPRSYSQIKSKPL